MLNAARQFRSPLKSLFRFFKSSSASLENLINSEVLSINEEIKYALQKQHPIVALESTIITHGLPYPNNVECAIDVEQEVRKKGAVPATIAILNGVIKVGLAKGELEILGNVSESSPVKTSRRDFPYVLSKNLNGGTTVSGTLIVADKVGIPLFATGGIGGVHRQGETTFDISADLTELGRSQVAVVSSGVKSILDIPKTLEYLETQGVLVAAYGSTDDFPAFYSRKSGCKAPYSVSNPTEAARIISSSINMNLKSGMLFGVPVPEEHALDENEIQEVIEKALEEAKKQGICGKQITPFLLRKIWEITQGKSLHTNIALIKNNASVAAEIAVELAKLHKPANSSALKLGEEGTNDGIVVIGGSNLDLCAKIEDGDIKLDGRMHPSKLSYVPGGVARNICESLMKLGNNPTFITAIGDDEPGGLLKSMMPHKMRKFTSIIKGPNTAQCIIVLDANGDCSCLLADLEIHAQITPQQIKANQEIISEAKLIVLDANLSVDSLESTLKLATEYNIPVFFEPTDVIVSAKPFETKYWRAVKFISPNVNELLFMASKLKISSIEHSMKDIHGLGNTAKVMCSYVDNIIVTMGSNGILIARKARASDPFLLETKDSNVEVRYYPAPIVDGIVNVSGAGDSFASGFIVAMLRGFPEDVCVSVGFAAARQTLLSPSNVASEMFDQTHWSWKEKAKYITI